jgi:L-fuconolactonase
MGPLVDLARYENVYIKFSTVNLRRLTEAHVDAEPALRLMVERFSARRIFWGSDSPNSPGEYGDLLRQMRKEIASFSQTDQDWIMAETAMAVYPKLKASK